VHVCGARATFLYGASSHEHRRYMAPYALHREAMQIAAQEGCKEYDFLRLRPVRPSSASLCGISRFKRQWGGCHRSWVGGRDYLFYDRVADRVVERLLNESAV
jgi:lipid II:glycine glycyltransferase (peptidoglycan interpeptide bridge formation enzyme)